MKIILIAGFVFFVLYLAWREFLKRSDEKFDLQKSENKIVGTSTIQAIDELEFLTKYFKGKFNHKNWRTKIKDKILKEKFDELTEKYNIIVERK